MTDVYVVAKEDPSIPPEETLPVRLAKCLQVNEKTILEAMRIENMVKHDVIYECGPDVPGAWRIVQEGDPPMREVHISVASKEDHSCTVERMPLKTAFLTMAAQLLDAVDPGWEYGEPCRGCVEFNAATGDIIMRHGTGE